MSAFLRSAAFKALHRLRPGDDLLSRMREADAYQHLPREVQLGAEVRALQSFLRHIREHVPYYADALPSDLAACVRLEAGRIEWGDVPLLDKTVLRAHPQAVRSRHPGDRGLANATSGSTGESLRFDLDASSRTVRAATTHRFHGWAGVHPWDRQARLWGARFDAPARGLRQTLTGWVQPSRFLSSYELSESAMRAYADELEQFRPTLLVSYPSPLEHFAAWCGKQGRRFASLRAIVCSAEQLHPHQRQAAQDAFGCPVFDRYGSREFANVAQECEAHDGLHVATDHVHVEILRPDGQPASDGELGELVITDPRNRAMPFVRYRTGDLARWQFGPCDCGRTLPRIAALEGRDFELIRAPGGEVISGTFWPQVVKQASSRVRLYQVVQTDLATIDVRLVMEPAGALEPREEESLRGRIRDHAPSLGVRISYVEDVPLTPGGKRRTVIGLDQSS